jgi:hypothetical protein
VGDGLELREALGVSDAVTVADRVFVFVALPDGDADADEPRDTVTVGVAVANPVADTDCEGLAVAGRDCEGVADRPLVPDVLGDTVAAAEDEAESVAVTVSAVEGEAVMDFVLERVTERVLVTVGCRLLVGVRLAPNELEDVAVADADSVAVTVGATEGESDTCPALVLGERLAERVRLAVSVPEGDAPSDMLALGEEEWVGATERASCVA